MTGRRLCAVLALGTLAVTPLTANDLTIEQIRESVLGSMDRTADPCDDFYRYACWRWLDATELPSDQARWTRSFSVISCVFW